MKNCGMCRYFKTKDGRMGECFSHPPVVMAGTKTGRVRCFRPVVQKTDPTCSEFRKGDFNDTNKRSDNKENGAEGPQQTGNGDADGGGTDLDDSGVEAPTAT